MNIPQQPHFFKARVVKPVPASHGTNRADAGEDSLPAGPSAESAATPLELENEITADDIQEAYLRALQVMEEIEGQSFEEDDDSAAVDSDTEESSAADSPGASEAALPAEIVPPQVEAETDVASPSAESSAVTEGAAESAVVDEMPASEQAIAEAIEVSTPPAPASSSLSLNAQAPEQPLPGPSLTPAQIIEAILFVGGNPITAKRLCNVLGGSADHQFVEQRIDELNADYASQGRPYEIRLGDGGYRLALRPEFEAVRNKVHGAGPREVRLSQDALEILALVAYRQPISPEDIEASGKKNASNLVRQLIRRELVAIHRIDSTRAGIRYQTTPRFLSLFGLSALDELPQADELSMR